MAKDPAFLFYSSDFLTGTSFMNFEDKGKYITILCQMHQHGRLNEESICFLVGSVSVNLKAKFRIDEGGFWYNERLELETEKRNKFTESRRTNGLMGGRGHKKAEKQTNDKKNNDKASAKHMDKHMEDENEDVNDIIINTKESKISKTFVPEPILMLTDLSKKYKSDELWIASVTKTLSLKRMEAVSSLIDKFLIHLETQKTTEKTEKDFREHFVNWARKQGQDSKHPTNAYTPPLDHP